MIGIATTGGGSAAAATPTSAAQLLSWLADSTAVSGQSKFRVMVLRHVDCSAQ